MGTVIDSHHHVGNLVVSTTVNRHLDRPEPWAPIDESEYAARLAMMKSADVDQAVLMPVNRYLTTDGIAATRRVNDSIARYRDRDSDRFVAALGVVEPLHGDAGLQEIYRLKNELGLVGVSYHTRWQGVATNDPWVFRHVGLLAELQLLPVIHAHAESKLESPSMIGQIAKAFPALPILVMDAMSNNSGLMHLLDVATKYANIYLETSLITSPAAFRQVVSEVGAERTVFGTDTYSHRMLTRHTPAVIRGFGFASEDTARILGGTMRHLLEWAGLSG